jgi:hypothetical protein
MCLPRDLTRLPADTDDAPTPGEGHTRAVDPYLLRQLYDGSEHDPRIRPLILLFKNVLTSLTVQQNSNACENTVVENCQALF